MRVKSKQQLVKIVSLQTSRQTIVSIRFDELLLFVRLVLRANVIKREKKFQQTSINLLFCLAKQNWLNNH